MKGEQAVYQKLIDMADEKKESIIQGRTDDLEKISSIEQDLSDELKGFENKRMSILRDMAVVTGHDGQTITVSEMIDLLDGQPESQKALKEAKESLTSTASTMQFLNQQNQILLKQALELVEFDLTLFKSMKQAPETANYNKNAHNTGDLLGSTGFDAKQ